MKIFESKSLCSGVSSGNNNPLCRNTADFLFQWGIFSQWPFLDQPRLTNPLGTLRQRDAKQPWGQGDEWWIELSSGSIDPAQIVEGVWTNAWRDETKDGSIIPDSKGTHFLWNNGIWRIIAVHHSLSWEAFRSSSRRWKTFSSLWLSFVNFQRVHRI